MAEDARKIGADGGAGGVPELMVQKFSPLPTGTRLGELSIQSVLGAGECGITYIAVHEGSNRRFVLKEYLPRAIAFRDGLTVRVSAANTPAFAWGLDRFVSEGKLLGKIKHPAIVGVQSSTEGNGTGYIVMTHEVGRDLGIWLHELRRRPTQQELDTLAKPLLEALGILHGKDILHLDITPSNILVRDNGTPVLIDFGAVRFGMRRRLNLATPSEAKAFMAPEVPGPDQALVGPHSDIYSLSAVIYLLATGITPPQADKRVLRDELLPMRDATTVKLRPRFMAGIDAGLEFRPDDRPQQISTWQEELLQPEQPAAKKAEDPAAANDPAPAPMASSRMYSYGEDRKQGEAAAGEPIMDNPAFRQIFFGAIGAIGGGLAGALSSIVIASIMSSSCYTDACVMPILPFTAAAGALVGVYFGAQYGRSTAPAETRPSQTDIEA